MNLNDLNAALENNDITLFLIALRAVVHVNGGIAYLADETGLHRETLYRTLSPDGNPTIKSLMLILDALNLKLHVEEKE